MNFHKILLTILSVAKTLSCISEEASESNPMANIGCEPSSIAFGCVNVITGEYVESSTDISIPGIKSLNLVRSYRGKNRNLAYESDSQRVSLKDAWHFNHDIHYRINSDEERLYYEFHDENGMVMHYTSKVGDGELKVHPTFNKEMLQRSVTNCFGGEISGRSNIKNIRMMGFYNKKRMRDGAGTLYIFQKNYDIKKMELPSRNSLEFDYEDENRLLKIRLNNGAGTEVASIDISYLKPDKKSGITQYRSSDGQRVDYQLKYWKKQLYEFEVKASHFPTIRYHFLERRYRNGDDRSKILDRIAERALPDNRFKEIYYYHSGVNDAGPLRVDGSIYQKRVKSIFEPAGHDTNPFLTAVFVYDNFKTSVYDALHHKTHYRYNKDHRITEIQRFKGRESHFLWLRECFFWGANDSTDVSQLTCSALLDRADSTLFCRKFHYDSKGNVLKEHLYGDFTGRVQDKPIVEPNGNVQPRDCDVYETLYTYSNDGRNLLTSKKEKNQLTEYDYYSKENVVKAEYLITDGTIRKRSFYSYDQNGVVQSEISDDGTSREEGDLSGVTERRIKKITNSMKNPCGKPLIVEEYFLDLASNSPMLMQKTVNTYNVTGQLLLQNIYDSNQQLATTCSWEYDNFGNVIREVDALGRTTIKSYDANNNCIHEQKEHCSFEYTYNCMNRLIKNEKFCSDGTRITETYHYDLVGNKIGKIDSYGNETSYVYDSLGQVTKVILPPILLENGAVERPCSVHDYDPLGHQILSQSPGGGIVKKRYTTHGKPLQIDHPDGTCEKYAYTLEGYLKRSTAKNGSYIEYHYDNLGRPIKIESFDREGNPLSQRELGYNSFHLLWEKDPAGLITDYVYDGAGRLIQTKSGNRKVDQYHDTLGRVTEIRTWSDESHWTALVKTYDTIGRMSSKKILNEEGTLFSYEEYTHDTQDRLIEIKTHTGSAIAISTYRYDARGDLVEQSDALGNSTYFSYDYNYINSLGQRVLQKSTTDALGNILIEEYDALGNSRKIEKKNPLGIIFQAKSRFYNLEGAVTKEIWHGVEETKTQNVKFCFLARRSSILSFITLFLYIRKHRVCVI